jgi:hypothetical protein
MRIPLAVLALALAAAGPQDDKTLKIDDFESDLSGWTAVKADEATGFGEDAESKVAITREAGQAKAGAGALSYAYEVAPKTMRVLALQRELDLTGMKSLRLWVKCSRTTGIVVSLAEKGGASYQASVYCAEGKWQEVAVNLDELAPDEPGKDANGTLDLAEIASLQVFDVGGFLATFLPELKGARTLWLDDVTFSSRRVSLTTGPTKVTRVTPVHLVDNFESPLIRWTPISVEFSDTPKFNLFDGTVSVDSIAPPDGGRQALKFAYPRRGAKVYGLLRDVSKVDLSKALGLDLWVRTSSDGTIIVSLEEKDGSRYQRSLELQSSDGWKQLAFSLGDFTLADDSQDENGRLDAGQIKQVSIADLTQLLGGGEVDENRLWLDEVLFILGP